MLFSTRLGNGSGRIKFVTNLLLIAYNHSRYFLRAGAPIPFVQKIYNKCNLFRMFLALSYKRFFVLDIPYATPYNKMQSI